MINEEKICKKSVKKSKKLVTKLQDYYLIKTNLKEKFM